MKYISNKKIKNIFWIIFTIVISIFFIFIFSKEIDYKKILESNKNTAIAIQSLNSEETKPEYSYFIKDPNNLPNIDALAYLVGDLDTGEIIFSKNQDEVFPIASVSKLMTALIATELMDENDIATISKKSLETYGENGNFKIGEKIKITDILYPLLLESSNDAAEIIAEYFNRNIFIKKMNETANNLELSKTTFEDPSGLSSANQSTVFDMFKLMQYLNQKKPELLEITTNRSYFNEKHNWSSNNQFLHEEGYLGGKSGYTDPAKQTVVSLFSLPLAEFGTRNIAITLLQSKNRFTDVENIIKYLEKNVYYGEKTNNNVTWIKEKNNLPILYDQDFVTLLFGGDIMLDRGVKNSINKNYNGDYLKLFDESNLSDLLKNLDIVFANLEGPASNIGKDQKNLYSFRMDPSIIPALKGAGFSVLSVANNHVGDWGREAYEDTLKRLKENEISYIGGGLNTNETENPIIIEKYGIKIGYLGFSDVGPNWMEATENQAGILLANNPRFSEIIKNASEKVDYLIVSFHFGDEYQTKHNARQEYLAHSAIDAGAKIIIGHHPHVIEDTEIYSPKDCIQSSCMGYIAYSLGNFIFDQGFSENTMKGMLLEIKLWRDGSLDIKKNIIYLNKYFQPEKVVEGKEEKIKLNNNN